MVGCLKGWKDFTHGSTDGRMDGGFGSKIPFPVSMDLACGGCLFVGEEAY